MITAASGRERGTHWPTASGLVRRASTWLPGECPAVVSLDELGSTVGARWVEVHPDGLRSTDAIAALNAVCNGELTRRMARDLVTPRRFPAAGTYEPASVRMTAGFLVRHLQSDCGEDDSAPGPVASVLKPVQLLVGGDWLLSAWLDPRLFRGSPEALEDDRDGDDAGRLYLATAARWPDSGGETADDLAELIRRELEVASGHRSPAF